MQTGVTGFELGGSVSRESCKKRAIYFTSTGVEFVPVDKTLPADEWVNSNGEKPMGHMDVYIRQLVGADSMALADLMVEQKRGGNNSLRAGTVMREKVCRAVFEINTLIMNGREFTKIDKDIFKKIPAWLAARLIELVNEVNGEVSEDEVGN